MATRIRTQSVPGLDPASLLKLYRLMLLARTLDEAELKLKRQQKSYFQISGAGHEAVQAAATLLLKPGYDWFYPYYRDRTLCLGLGVTPLDIFLQSMARGSDPSSGGREMPAHYGSPGLHIVNQSSPTGTQYLQAVGTAEAGLIARCLEKEPWPPTTGTSAPAPEQIAGLVPHFPPYQRDEIVYVSGGEGSTSEGEFFEAISAASLRKLPMLFLIEDNEYAISVPAEFQTPGGSISALVRGFPNFFIEETNGLDVIESYHTLRRAVSHVRSGKGPALVHAHVVRLAPHSDSDDDRAYRPPHEKRAEQARDPIPAFEEVLLQAGCLRHEDAQAILAEVRQEVEEAAHLASLEPEPDPSSVTLHVFNPRTVVEVESEPRGEGPPITIVEAVNRTLEAEMQRDARVVVFGEDVADVSRTEHLQNVAGKGGVFKVTHHLQKKFGEHRVFNTPIAEAGIVGRAFGLAVRGFIPVAEIQFFDYIWPAMQQLRNELSVLRWRSNNAFSAPVVLRVPIGGYLTGGGIYHSQCGESIFCHCPGLRVVLPSNARDAAGLLRTAIRCGDPVLFLEHKHLYRQSYARAPYPGPDYVIPLGRAATVREGKHVTIITYGALVEKSLRAADEVAEEGIEVEVIDLRSLQPYDWEAIATSVCRTHRAIVAYEDTRTHGFGAEVAARIGEELFVELDAPVVRVAALDSPVGYSPVLEKATLPQVKDIADAVRRVRAF
ncbi:MAG TPA: dehydrogenase E1 component subunit alpha/beta [Planctomycetota bacterium]|nr:dehydrogenase E1 component subunit alpha/beta [Planctomycetota bacterium]